MSNACFQLNIGDGSGGSDRQNIYLEEIFFRLQIVILLTQKSFTSK